MERRHVVAGAPEVRTPIRVRGMSHEALYFDEQASTTHITHEFIVMETRNRVDLDSELHVTNVRNQIGGIYRVAWTNAQPQGELYRVGLELLDPEGEIWEADFIFESADTGEIHPVSLECERCKGRISLPILEAHAENVRDGFSMSRTCDTCKATTGWVYAGAAPANTEAAPAPAATAFQQVSQSPLASATASTAAPEQVTPFQQGGIDQRKKGRAPIRLSMKLTRKKYGKVIYDICETINVSRTGVYFRTDQAYEPGENVYVVLPYDPGNTEIPVPGKVVRQDLNTGTYVKFVAIHLTPGIATAT
jgi:hypothetical protein